MKPTRRFDKRILILGLPLVVALGYIISISHAASGTLYLTPPSLVVANGATFTVDVRESSGTELVNAVQANLTYTATQVDFVSIDSSTSAFGTEAEATGGAGVVHIARGTTTSISGDQLVAKVTFRSKLATGLAAINFGAGSALVRSSDNTDILVTSTGGSYGPDSAAPSVPTGLVTSAITGTAATVSWAASTDNVGVTGYRVYRNNVLVASPTTLSFADSGLTMSTTYSYTVSAVDAAGNESAKSTTLSVTTKDTAAPSVPAITSVTAPTYSQITLSWSASTDTGGSGLKGYKVYRNGGGTAIASPTTASFTDTGLTGSTMYTYTVSAIDNAGNESAKSASSGITTPVAPDTTAPSAPTSLRTSGTTLTSVSLAWNASTDNIGVTGYRVMSGATVLTTTTQLAFTESSLQPSTSRTYTVVALDAAGNVSAASTPLTVSTLVQKKGDINLDNAVNIFDLSIFLTNWGTTNASCDLNNDGSVNIFDLSILLANWLK